MKTYITKYPTRLALIACLATTVNAQTAGSADTSTPASSSPAAASQPAVKSKDTISVDYPDEEIRVVLRNVADLFELNLVIPETLQGKTSIKLRDVTWRQIFQVVLAPVNYTFIEDGNIIKVVTQESLTLEPLTTDVFVLNYAKAAEIKPSLDALVDAKVGGKIVVDGRSNALVISERASVIQKIRPIVLNLDRATEQVMIESKFIEITDSDAKNIGINWQSLNGYGIGVADIKRSYGANAGRNSGEGFSEENINVGHNNDVSNRGYGSFPGLKQEIVPNVPSIYGLGQTYTAPVDPADPAGPTQTNALVNSFPDAKAGNSKSLSFLDNLSRIDSAVFSADQFKLVISALKTLNTTKLVSNPTLVTLNNSEATINIGEEFPLPNYTYNQERGAFEVSGFTFKPIGVILKVTPQVNNAGFIRLNLEPEVSNRTNTVNFGGASGAVIPVIGVRKTKTQITIKDGYTLGLGGLMESSSSDGSSKVPVLSSIPGLGKLFKSSSKNETKRNLVIFVTAKTLKPDGATAGEVFDPRNIRDMKIQKDELPGFRDGSDPFAPAPSAAK
jgi:type IV pilus assembly protein PilQ